ncbi:MAG: hypothetical protein JO345_19680 [Streptosporangiaceae bacterium]|nr:hypothetical protein [Streptosporangiaceae bacterium]
MTAAEPGTGAAARGELGFDLLLKVDAGHLGQAEKVDGGAGEFFPDIDATFAPRIEGFGYLTLKQAELQRHIGEVESPGRLVIPCELLR